MEKSVEELENQLTIGEFIVQLWENFLNDKNSMKKVTRNSLLEYGHQKGWLEDSDVRFCEQLLVRRDAARILHNFMKIELLIPDFEKIDDADILQDLYSCRVCVNHVAQIYLRKFFEAEEIQWNNQIVLIFNMLKPVSKDEVLKIIKKISLELKN